MIHPFYNLLPELEPDEMAYAQSVSMGFNDADFQLFANMYRYRRKDPQMILFTCLIGFFGFAGIHRFILNQVGMGVLYFFTGGLCLIGTIVDLINHRALTFEFNRQMMNEVVAIVKGMRG